MLHLTCHASGLFPVPGFKLLIRHLASGKYVLIDTLAGQTEQTELTQFLFDWKRQFELFAYSDRIPTKNSGLYPSGDVATSDKQSNNGQQIQKAQREN